MDMRKYYPFLYKLFYHYNDLPIIAYTMTFYDFL